MVRCFRNWNPNPHLSDLHQVEKLGEKCRKHLKKNPPKKTTPLHSDRRRYYSLSLGAHYIDILSSLHYKQVKYSKLFSLHILYISWKYRNKKNKRNSSGFHPTLGPWCGFGEGCYVDFCLVTVLRNLKRSIVVALESWGIWEGQVCKIKQKERRDRKRE